MPRLSTLTPDQQRLRARVFGIELLPSEHVVWRAPTGGDAGAVFADPVNQRWRIDSATRLAGAREAFKRSAGMYADEASRRRVHTRIVTRQLRRGLPVAIVPGDPLDELLPSRLRQQYARGASLAAVAAQGDLHAATMQIRRGPGDMETLPPPDPSGAGVDNFIITLTLATNAVITRFTKSGEPEIITRKALDSIGRWLTTKYRTAFLDHDRRDRTGHFLDYRIEDVDTGESTSQLVMRMCVSKRRGDLQQEVREGTLYQASVWFAVPAGQAVRRWVDKVKAHCWFFEDAEGYEGSLVGMAVDPGATVHPFAVARAVGAVAADAQVLEQAFEVAAPLLPVDAVAGAAFPVGELGDDEMVRELAESMQRAPVFFGEGDEAVAQFAEVTVRDGVLGLRVGGDELPLADGPLALVVRGVARFQGPRVVALQFCHAELSTDTEPRGFEEIRGMSTPTRETSFKRINEILSALKSAPPEQADALRVEADELYNAVPLEAGERLVHPLSAGFEGEYPWPASPGGTGTEGVGAGAAPAGEPPPAAGEPTAAPATPAAGDAGAAEAPPAATTLPPSAPAPTAPTAPSERGVSVKRSITDFDFARLWEMVADLDWFLRISPELEQHTAFFQGMQGVVARLRELLVPNGVTPEPLPSPDVARAVSDAFATAGLGGMAERFAALEAAVATERERVSALENRVSRAPVGTPPARAPQSTGSVGGAKPGDGPARAAPLTPDQWSAFAKKTQKEGPAGASAV